MKAKDAVRNRLAGAIRRAKGKKSSHTMDLIGCTIDFLMAHLESKFEPWMSWANHGKWHIDHIIPCSAFDLTCPEQQKLCFRWQNLQPLSAKENMMKGSKLEWTPLEAIDKSF